MIGIRCPLRRITPRTLVLGAVLVLVVVAASACQPAVAHTPAPVNAGAPCTWEGDSISVQIGSYAGLDGYQFNGLIGLGWQAEHATRQLRTYASGATSSPPCNVVEFGHNDARPTSEGGDGFTQADRNQLLINVVSTHRDTCTVLVKPAYTGPNLAHWWGIEQYRGWVDEMVGLGSALGRRFEVVDLAPLYPAHAGPDGVHVREPAAAGQSALAFRQTIEKGIGRCLGPTVPTTEELPT